MALPDSRDETLIDGVSTVKASLLNNLQDGEIGGKHGDVVEGLIGMAAVQISGAAVTKNFSSFTTTGVCVMQFHPQLREGDRLKSFSLKVSGNGVADINAFDVYKQNAAGVEVLLGTVAVNNPAAGIADYPNNIADYTLVAGDTIRATLSINAAAITVYDCRWTKSHP